VHEVSLVHSSSIKLIGRSPASELCRASESADRRAAGVDPSFRTAFDGCREERGYAAAALEVAWESSAWSCRACGAVVGQGGPLRCAACGGEARLSAGGDLILDRLELEVVDV
jgi:hypothetical protein